MRKERILVVEAEQQQAGHIQSILDKAQYVASTVTSCAEAAEALMLEKFDVVLIGSGQSETELAELAGCVRSSSDGASLLAYGGEARVTADAKLPADFDPAQFDAALRDVAAKRSRDEASPQLVVFEPEEFAEQCAGETSLMVEIIDLFEAERHDQMAAMNSALEANDFHKLARLAHTLKGSVGALHAPASRQTCQAIELAAKDRDPKLCEIQLRQLSRNLADLEEPLRRFRSACLET